MTPEQSDVVDGMPSAAKRAVGEYFGLDKPSAKNLLALGLGQADVVLALLRTAPAEAGVVVEKLVGRPIEKCPPDKQLNPEPHPAVRRSEGPDERTVLLVGPNPRTPGTSAHKRFSLVRPGLLVRQLIVRGITRRDLRELRYRIVYEEDAT